MGQGYTSTKGSQLEAHNKVMVILPVSGELAGMAAVYEGDVDPSGSSGTTKFAVTVNGVDTDLKCEIGEIMDQSSGDPFTSDTHRCFFFFDFVIEQLDVEIGDTVSIHVQVQGGSNQGHYSASVLYNTQELVPP